MPVTLYIANGLGFSSSARTSVLSSIVRTVTKMGYDVIEPFQDNNELDLSRERNVAVEMEIARRDVDGVRRADGVLCVVSSPVPDEGVMIEVGLAIAWSKPVFILNDDFRYSPSNTVLPMNLMLFAGMNAETWRKYYYTSVDDLENAQKALGEWIQHARLPPGFNRELGQPCGHPCA